MALSDDRIARWARQLLVPGFGEAGQERLQAARVRVVGCDAVAAPGLVALVQAGIGKLWLDDAEDVSPADLGWIYPPSSAGTPRVDAARAALAPMSRFVTIERYPTGGVPTATLVCAPSVAQALAAAEASRRAGLPHAVVEPDADGGSVVTVPPGAPCYSCGRSVTSSGRPPQPGAGALSGLAAQELLQMIATPGVLAGRRVDLVRGVTTTRPTARLPGCVCGAEPAAAGGG